MKTIVFVHLFVICTTPLRARVFSSNSPLRNGFSVLSRELTIYVDESDDWLVQQAALLLKHDFKMIAGHRPTVVHELPKNDNCVIIIGTIDKKMTVLSGTIGEQQHYRKNNVELYP